MRIDTTIVIKDLEGNPLPFKEGVELTVGRVVAKACSEGKNCDPVIAWSLAQKFHNQEEVDVKAEDIVFIKDRLKDSGYFPIVTGQLTQILDGEVNGSGSSEATE